MYLGAINVEPTKKSKISVFDYLNLRSDWEDLVKDFQMDEHRKYGTVDNLRIFVEEGPVGNRFRKGFDEAYEIAETILENT